MQGKRFWHAAIVALVILGALTLPVAMAQEEAGSQLETVQQTMTLKEVLKHGGPLMYVLGAMSVLALAFVVYFVVVLREDKIAPKEFIRDIRQMLASGRLEEVSAACEKNGSPVAAVAAVAAAYAQRAEEVDASLLKEIMEGEGSRQANLIQNQTQYLLDIAVISPMVGLLGTVMGMLTAFNAVALDIAKAQPLVLTGGVSRALITTAAGLIVGIPAMVFYAYFRGRSSKLLSNLEAASADFLTLLVEERRKNRGITTVGGG